MARANADITDKTLSPLMVTLKHYVPFIVFPRSLYSLRQTRGDNQPTAERAGLDPARFIFLAENQAPVIRSGRVV